MWREFGQRRAKSVVGDQLLALRQVTAQRVSGQSRRCSGRGIGGWRNSRGGLRRDGSKAGRFRRARFTSRTRGGGFLGAALPAPPRGTQGPNLGGGGGP